MLLAVYTSYMHSVESDADDYYVVACDDRSVVLALCQNQ